MVEPKTCSCANQSQSQGQSQDQSQSQSQSAAAPLFSAQEEQNWAMPTMDRTNGADFMEGYLRNHVGEFVSIQFLIGMNTLLTRRGTLLSVGKDNIVLRQERTDDILVTDLFSVMFVTFYY